MVKELYNYLTSGGFEGYGSSISLSADGKYIAIGSPKTGANDESIMLNTYYLVIKKNQKMSLKRL